MELSTYDLPATKAQMRRLAALGFHDVPPSFEAASRMISWHESTASATSQQPKNRHTRRRPRSR